MRIAGVGCSLVDFLYSDVDFACEAFQCLLSRAQGDGGLMPGGLVFRDEFERFSGRPFDDVLRTLVGERSADTYNIGGPAIVALILAAQLLAPRGWQVAYYGAVGDDEAGRLILDGAAKTPLDITNYGRVPGTSPSTSVLSDPRYDGGHGERIFVNNLGVARDYGPECVPDSFFDSEVALFGATALTPQLHANLTALLRKAKERGCFNIITTVYDFQNEKRNPGGVWPLGESDETYRYADLLVTDHIEALRISGAGDVEGACEWFRRKGLAACVVTQGPRPVWFYAQGGAFGPVELMSLPVSQAVGDALRQGLSTPGDTTGCGDNFAGGVLTSLAVQLADGCAGRLDLKQAVALGVCAGGAACFQLGGMALENHPGERQAAIMRLYEQYGQQVAAVCRLKADPLDPQN
ncbi:MAG TPA: carbohydrate kinase family protein [Candidatus Sumerlaeota bacterium]|nr:carbohydrate kinase family protein [Candidatus Sumerlaeota bacterium]HPS01223.1 carbohydrate kinase family protein [Candidatus Sumerlaeota bacterium]